MADYTELMWWATDNDECFNLGPYATMEDAIEEGKYNELGYNGPQHIKDEHGHWIKDADGEYIYTKDPHTLTFMVAQCATREIFLDQCINGTDILERIEDSLCDYKTDYGDYVIIDTTDKQDDSFEAAIKMAVYRWQKENKIHFETQTFEIIKNKHIVRCGEKEGTDNEYVVLSCEEGDLF